MKTILLCNTFKGQAFGARRLDLMRDDLHRGFLLCLIVFFCLSLPLLLCSEYFANWMSPSAEVTLFVSKYLLILAPGGLIRMLNLVYDKFCEVCTVFISTAPAGRKDAGCNLLLYRHRTLRFHRFFQTASEHLQWPVSALCLFLCFGWEERVLRWQSASPHALCSRCLVYKLKYLVCQYTFSIQNLHLSDRIKPLPK